MLDVMQVSGGSVGERGTQVVVGTLAHLAAFLGQNVGQRVLCLAASEATGGRLTAADMRRGEKRGGLLGRSPGDTGLDVPNRAALAFDELEMPGNPSGSRRLVFFGLRARGPVRPSSHA